MLFKIFNLSESNLRSIHEKGYFRPTPIPQEFNPEIITEKSKNKFLAYSKTLKKSEKGYFTETGSIDVNNLIKSEHLAIQICYQYTRT